MCNVSACYLFLNRLIISISCLVVVVVPSTLSSVKNKFRLVRINSPFTIANFAFIDVDGTVVEPPAALEAGKLTKPLSKNTESVPINL